MELQCMNENQTVTILQNPVQWAWETLVSEEEMI
jgi:hypothetical protein